MVLSDTLHWESQPAFAELFPYLEPRNQLYCHDGQYITCGGGNAGVDLFVARIDEHHGHGLATKVADNDCYRQTPLPLVLAPAPCIYRDRMLSALTDVERACRIVYLSSSYNGISAAVRAGIGITGMTNSTKPPGCQALPDSLGLPPLGQLEVRLHRGPGKLSVALSRLEDYIAGSFASNGATRIAIAGSD